MFVPSFARDKQNKAVEFGTKLSVSLAGDEITSVDELHWHAFHEEKNSISQFGSYKARHKHYPEKVLAGLLCCTRVKQNYLNEKVFVMRVNR